MLKAVFFFLYLLAPLFALTQAEQIQKAREEIFQSIENESALELEEINPSDSTFGVVPPPPTQTIEQLPTPNLANPSELPEQPNVTEQGSARSLYLSHLNPLSRTLYVGEVVPLSYKLVVFGELQGSIETTFVGDNSVIILNDDSPWRQNSDGTFNNTFYAQIKSANFTIPKLKVAIEVQGGELSQEISATSGQAITLSGNPLFSHVIASDFSLDDYKITSYDTQNNLAVFAISTGISNIQDLRIGHYPRQNYESGVMSPEKSSIIYYVIIPKEVEPIAFDYFSTQDFQFHRITISNVPIDDRVSTQSDLKPKRTISLFQISVGSGAILFLLIAFAITRSWLCLCGIALVIAYFIVDIFITDTARLLPNAEVKILPTFNSTVIIRQESPLSVEILDKRNGFYKIVTNDGRIGWVRREEVEH
ncbi:MAG: SH3 domain-containing protein [Helicobacter sp.]|nr:SH3 domain-containing protein [Helicobacter sp.]